MLCAGTEPVVVTMGSSVVRDARWPSILSSSLYVSLSLSLSLSVSVSLSVSLFVSPLWGRQLRGMQGV